jgi:hypothetical protein
VLVECVTRDKFGNLFLGDVLKKKENFARVRENIILAFDYLCCHVQKKETKRERNKKRKIEEALIYLSWSYYGQKLSKKVKTITIKRGRTLHWCFLALRKKREIEKE